MIDLRNDLAVADHHHRVRIHLLQLLHHFRPSDALRLMDRQSQAAARLPSPAKRQLSAASFGPVGLREHGQNAMARLDDPLERGNRERGGAQKNQRPFSTPFTELADLAPDQVALEGADVADVRRPFRWSISWQKARASRSSPVISNDSPLTFWARTVTLLGRVTCSRNPGRLRQPSSPV